MAELTWFPLDVDEWAKLTQELTVEEEGALLRLARRAWSNLEQPGTLPATPDELALALGAKWKRYLPVVDRFFPVQDGRRRWPWLVGLYAAQLAKHRVAVEKGRKGGRPRTREKGEKKAGGKAQVSAQLPSVLSQKLREKPLSLTGQGVSPADRAPAAAEAPRPSAEPRDQLAEQRAVERWLAEHPDEAAALEQEARETVHAAPDEQLTGSKAAVVRGYVRSMALMRLTNGDESPPTDTNRDTPRQIA